MNANLSIITKETGINTTFDNLSTCIYSAFDVSCTLKTKTIAPTQLRKPWISNDILSDIRLRNAYSVLWKAGKFASHLYRQFRHSVTNKIRTSKRHYYAEKLDAMKNNDMEIN